MSRAKTQAPKGRNNSAQGSALGNLAAQAQSPKGAAQKPSSHSTPSLRPLSSFLREPLRNGHSATASSDPDGIRTLTLTAVTVGDFSERNTKITSADARRVKDLWLETGDILIQRSNAPELVGTSRLYRGDKNYAIFPDLMIRVRLNGEADPRFIELVLQSEPLRQYFKGRAKGMSGSMPKIDQETILEAPIPLFDIDDQRRIVAEIEKQFTRLEAGVAALRRVQANLKRYRAAVLKAACEGRLVPTEAELSRSGVPPLDPASTTKPPHSKDGAKVSANPKRQDAASTFESGQQLLARILTERRQNWQGRGKYKESEEPTHGNLPELPNGWTWVTVEQLAAPEPNSITDGPFGSNLKTEHYTSNGPRVIRLMVRFRVKVFAAVVTPEAPRPADKAVLRRDYAFLFERFFHHLSSTSESEMGLIVFDELEKTQSKILLGQMARYFLETQTGYQRSARIVPEPFFVHSDLTTAVQLADLVAYCVSWAVRLNSMDKPAREELKPLADLVFGMRFVGSRFSDVDGKEWPVYGMFHLDDLRPRSERSP